MHDCLCEIWNCTIPSSSTTPSPTTTPGPIIAGSGPKIAVWILSVVLAILVGAFIWREYCARRYTRIPSDLVSTHSEMSTIGKIRFKKSDLKSHFLCFQGQSEGSIIRGGTTANFSLESDDGFRGASAPPIEQGEEVTESGVRCNSLTGNFDSNEQIILI